jgi:hypothetical protein
VEELIGRLGLSAPGQALILLGATAAFLAAPDVDLMLVRLLHHRSILTHSVLLPLLVPLVAGPLGLSPAQGAAAASGAALGVAVHLAADLLSPSRGYGRIWLPEPVQVSLGRWSPLWLMGSAVGSAWLAFARLPLEGGLRPAALAVGVAAALGYGIRRERSLLSALVALAVIAAGYGVERWLQTV